VRASRTVLVFGQPNTSTHFGSLIAHHGVSRFKFSLETPADPAQLQAGRPYRSRQSTLPTEAIDLPIGDGELGVDIPNRILLFHDWQAACRAAGVEINPKSLIEACSLSHNPAATLRLSCSS
jgi:hypothetical protein